MLTLSTSAVIENRSWRGSLLRPIFVAALLAAASAASAGSLPWEGGGFSASASEIFDAVSALPEPTDADVEVLLEEAEYRFDSDARLVETRRIVYRVLTPAGVAYWSTAEAEWRPWHQERPVLRARVISPRGSEHLLEPSTVTERPAATYGPEIFSDRRVLSAPLPGVTVGSVVEEQWVSRDRAPVFDRGAVHRFSFGRPVPVRRTRLSIEAPKSLPLHVVQQRMPTVVPSRVETGDTVRWAFETGPLEPTKRPEPLMPGDVPRYASVFFSTGKSWRDVATRYAQLVDARLAGAPLPDLTEGLSLEQMTREMIVNTLLERIHRNVRYVALHFGDSALIPHSPVQTLMRGYGDCKDKSALLVALLRELGIEAHLALLSVAPGQDVDPKLPGFGWFDHAIVYVPGPAPLWVDPTDRFARAGKLPVFDQGRLALVASQNMAGLVRTPKASPEENLTLETREVHLERRGPARVVETTETFGSVGRRLRRQYWSADRETIRSRMSEYARDTYLAQTLTSIEISDPEDLDTPFRIRLEMEDSKRGWTSPVDAKVAIFLAPLADRLPPFLLEGQTDGPGASREARRTDLELLEPFVREWRYRIVPPPGHAVRNLPEGEVISLGPTQLRKAFHEQDGVVTATFRFDTVKSRLSPEEVGALKAAIETLRESDPVIIAFDNLGEAHLGAGNVRGALESFRELASLYPDRALHQTQVAKALLAGGLGETARQAARRAIELEPDSAIAHQTLGWVLQHDLVGRRFERGFDYEGALAAYRTATELDPSLVQARVEMAILLEHDPEGVHYSEAARLDDAIEQYRFLRSELGIRQFDGNLLYALMWARRFQECKDAARSMGPEAEQSSIYLASVAALEGADEALRHGRVKIGDKETRHGRFVEASVALTRLRRYEEASQLLRAGAIGREDGLQLLARADMIGKLRRHEELSIEGSDPLSTIKRFWVAVLEPQAPPEPVLVQLADRVFDVDDDSDFGEQIEKIKGQLVSMIGGTDWPLEVALDFLLSHAQIRTEGDPKGGVRVTAVVPGTRGTRRQTFYMVFEDGRYRLAAVGADFGRLGRLALSFVEEGASDEAKRWLDWAREEVGDRGDADPLTGMPFTDFWSNDDTALDGRMRYAAASLMATDPRQARSSVAILREGYERAESDKVRLCFDRALARAYRSLEQAEDLLPVAERLHRAWPNSVRAFQDLIGVLRELRRWDDIRELAERRLEQRPDDTEAISALAGAAMAAGDFEEQARQHRRLMDIGKASPLDYNNLAWALLMADDLTEETVALAQQAVLLDPNPSTASLHTLATLYAEVGRATEARDLLVRALDTSGLDEPSGGHWYVLGRIAEQYESPVAALACYRKIQTEDRDAYLLARRRLREIASDSAAVPDPSAGTVN